MDIPVTIVWRRPNSDQLLVEHQLVAFHDKLMCPCNADRYHPQRGTPPPWGSDPTPQFLQGRPTANHTWHHHVALLVFCQWCVSAANTDTLYAISYAIYMHTHQVQATVELPHAHDNDKLPARGIRAQACGLISDGSVIMPYMNTLSSLSSVYQLHQSVHCLYKSSWAILQC